jgi:hypothetical protein
MPPPAPAPPPGSADPTRPHTPPSRRTRAGSTSLHVQVPTAIRGDTPAPHSSRGGVYYSGGIYMASPNRNPSSQALAPAVLGLGRCCPPRPPRPPRGWTLFLRGVLLGSCSTRSARARAPRPSEVKRACPHACPHAQGNAQPKPSSVRRRSHLLPRRELAPCPCSCRRRPLQRARVVRASAPHTLRRAAWRGCGWGPPYQGVVCALNE